MHTPGFEVDMGWGNHPTSIAGGVLIAVGEARLVMNKRPPVFVSAPFLFARAAGEGRAESRVARSSFTRFSARPRTSVLQREASFVTGQAFPLSGGQFYIVSARSSPELDFARVNIQCITVNHLAG
jgi:hypothetical protein